jgi:alcohol dehydrogenase (NADP+)
MTHRIKSYAALSATTPLAPHALERRSLRVDDVEIEILYCGVCHSDLHMARNDWGWSAYPLVPGHEIIGRVIGVGAQVSQFKIGDTVGVGCMVDSCQHCASCDQGHEQYCEEGHTMTYGGRDRHDGVPTSGGYSEKIVVTEKFVLRVPAGLDLAGAAPLLCAGVSTWSPLRHYHVGAGSRVAIVGLGGLGHMGLKLAKALGAEVTLITRSADKEADARRLGADHIVISTDAAQMAAAKGCFDLIIDTVPYEHDVNPLIPTLRVSGTLVMIGHIGNLSPTLNTAPLIIGRKALAGSLIGGIAETQAMFDFCAQHGITSDVELVAIQDIHNAFERMQKGDVKYRFVIDMASLKS